MNTDATYKKITQTEDTNAVLLRNEKELPHQESVISSITENLKTTNNSKAYKLHKKYLTFLQGYIVLLPDLKLHKPGKELASLVLSMAIDQGQRKEAISYLQDKPKVLKVTKFNFKLTSSTKVSTHENFKRLKATTTKRVEEMETFLKHK